MGGEAKFNARPSDCWAKFNALQSGCWAGLDDAAALLVEFYGLEQGLKIPFAEPLVALALNDLEEDRSDGVLGENLQQDTARRIAVDQDAAVPQFAQRLAMTGNARVDAFIVGGGCVLEFDAARAQGID